MAILLMLVLLSLSHFSICNSFTAMMWPNNLEQGDLDQTETHGPAKYILMHADELLFGSAS